MESLNSWNKPQKFSAHLWGDAVTLSGITGEEPRHSEQIYLRPGLLDYPVLSRTILILKKPREQISLESNKALPQRCPRTSCEELGAISSHAKKPLLRCPIRHFAHLQTRLPQRGLFRVRVSIFAPLPTCSELQKAQRVVLPATPIRHCPSLSSLPSLRAFTRASWRRKRSSNPLPRLLVCPVSPS